MKIGKWGSGLAVCLPGKLVRRLDIKVGDDHDILVEAGIVVVQFKDKPDLVLMLV